MRHIMPNQMPVMLAQHESRATSTSNVPVQLASLTSVPIDLRPDFGPVKIPDFKELIAKLQSEIPQAERPHLLVSITFNCRRIEFNPELKADRFGRSSHNKKRGPLSDIGLIPLFLLAYLFWIC